MLNIGCIYFEFEVVIYININFFGLKKVFYIIFISYNLILFAAS